MRLLGLRPRLMDQILPLVVIPVSSPFWCLVHLICRNPQFLRIYIAYATTLFVPGNKLTVLLHSHRKPESMVPIWRPGLHHRGFGHGAGHDSWSRLPIFRACPKEVGFEHDLGLYGFILRHHLSMVLLGLLLGLFAHTDERIHRGSEALRSYEHTRCSEPGLSSDP